MPGKKPDVPDLSRADMARIKHHVKQSAIRRDKIAADSGLEDPKAKSLPHYLTGTHHQKIQHIHKEQISAKAHRLQVLLIQKLTTQYGNRNKDIVVHHVENFLQKNMEKITSKDLLDLENEIINDIKAKNRSTQKEKKTNNALKDIKSSNSNEPETNSQEENKKDPIPQPSATVPIEGHEWELIAAYEKISVEERLKNEEQERKMKQSLLKRTLERQIEEAREMKKREKEIELREAAEKNKRDKEALEREEVKKQLEITKRHEEEKLIRDQQVQELKRRREAEIQSFKDAERAEVEKIEAIKKKEFELAILKKQEINKKRAEIVKANDELRKMKSIQKKEAIQEENRLMAEYNMKIEKEASEREEAFQKRCRALDEYRVRYMRTDGRNSEENIRKQDEKIVRAAEKKAQADHLYEMQQRDEKKRKEMIMFYENQEILRKKAEERKAKKATDSEYVAKMRSDTENYRKALEDRKLQDIEKQKKYREALLEQMHTPVKDPTNPKSFDDRECAVNGSLLKKITSDANLFSKVQDEVQKSRPNSAAMARRNQTASTMTLGQTSLNDVTDDFKPAVAWM
eukprot:CAMPEP_0182430724 /NCGR_PEP_ID=MMETSP1167-20130531/42817_1 /TAXON_ID=2988 /ORGANISM="Mallomonas Sp, Strain CCMP3275" /LENGTH=573 /DNA_ID=CAMNT_0024616139 /DNA_START=139 /DNA_END=1860 /DNA_ORIENTATION=-